MHRLNPLNKLCLWLACLTGWLPVLAQTDEAAAVKAVLLKQQNCWNSGDIPCFMQGYWKSDSLKFIGKSGITYGWQKTLDNYKKSYPDTASMGKLTFTLLEVKTWNNNEAYVLGKWYLQRSKGDVGGYFTLMFRKIRGEWVIVSDHTS